MADLPNVPRTIHGERRMTYRIPPWVDEKVHRWDRTHGRFTLRCWSFAIVTGVFTLASWLAGYGEQYPDYTGWMTFWGVVTVALIGWPVYRGGRLRAARVGMGARMAQLVDVGSLSWTRLPMPDRGDAEGVVHELFRAANRHDVTAAKYRVDMLARLERTCVISARHVAADVADLEDVEKIVVGREEVNGVD
jgi:hypothetical protein